MIASPAKSPVQNPAAALRRQMAEIEGINSHMDDLFVNAFSAGVRYQTMATDLKEAGHYEEAGRKQLEAERCFDISAKRSPEIWFALACSAMKAGDSAEAMDSLERVLKYSDKPLTRALCYNNIGTLLGNKSRREAAKVMFERGLEIMPDCAELIANKGLAAHWEGRDHDALRLIDKALRMNPKIHAAAFTKALIFLINGDWRNGWTWYESRFHDKNKRLKKPVFNKPEWDGCQLKGRRLLLWTEQGAGDTIHFMRFADTVRNWRGGRVSICPHRGLAPLCERTGWFDDVYPPEVDLSDEPFDFHCSLLSLPRLLGITLDNVPRETPYLRAGSPMALGEGYHVGIAWAGSSNHINDGIRSTQLTDWEPVLQVPGVRFHSLMTGTREADCRGDDRIFRFVPQFTNYDQTANAIDGMDMVISVDTSVAHLAGAMHKPVWMVCPKSPDWRWGYTSDTSVWYPSMRIFRQKELFEWGEVFQRVAMTLAMTLGSTTKSVAPEPNVSSS